MSIECPFCKCKDLIKRGKRKNKSVVKQRYLCKKCKKRFIETDGFERMRYKPKIIVRAIHMHEDGLSLSKVQNHLWQYDNVKVSRETLSNWIQKYSVFLKSDTFESQTNDKERRKNSLR